MNRQDQFEAIYEVVKGIPAGKVMSYGQIGAEAGTNARTVGWAMADVQQKEIPWHRVVGAGGHLRIGQRSPELMALQRALLEAEDVAFEPSGVVDMTKYLFLPLSGPKSSTEHE